MELNGSPPAEFRSDEDRTYFTVVLPIHPEAEKQTTQASTQVSTQVKALDEKELALLEFCKSPQDRAGIQKHLKMRSAKNLRERYLKPLLAAGLLEMTDPEHPNCRRLTTSEPMRDIIAISCQL